MLGLPADTPVTLRPWGGYVVLSRPFRREKQGAAKYLFVAPGGELSWQYHRRRAEEWVILSPGLETCVSDTDARGAWVKACAGDVLWIPTQQRHSCRNVSQRVGVVAEVWVGESDEGDIVRIEDVYGREKPLE